MLRDGPLRLEFLRVWQGVGWLMVLAVVMASLTGKPIQQEFITVWDKGLHCMAYAGLMWWFRQSFTPRRVWVLFPVLLGVLLEFIQGWLGYREFDPADILANCIGVILGLLLAKTAFGRTVEILDRRLARVVAWI